MISPRLSLLFNTCLFSRSSGWSPFPSPLLAPCGQVGARSGLQEALAALAEVHALKEQAPSLSSERQSALHGLLLHAAASDSHHARYCAMVWAGKAFASDDTIARYICFLGLGDERREVPAALQAAVWCRA